MNSRREVLFVMRFGCLLGGGCRISDAWTYVGTGYVVAFECCLGRNLDCDLGDRNNQLLNVESALLERLGKSIRDIGAKGGDRLFDKVLESGLDKRSMTILAAGQEIAQFAGPVETDRLAIRVT